MNKKDLVKKISKDSKIKIRKTSKIFDRVIDLISKDIRKKKIVSINDFGEFKIVRQEMKILRNKNWANVIIPPKDIVEFEMSDNLKSYFNTDG
ncbi:MAG: HU family DNA-binding protein [Ignavibacteria bacterium]|nr:HU family DNA-binding protein [Ignavibacteria bacterium]